MRNLTLALTLALFATAAPGAAFAQPAPDVPEWSEADEAEPGEADDAASALTPPSSLALRVWGGGSDLAGLVDGEPTSRAGLYSRLRLRFADTFGDLSVAADTDLISGQLLGDAPVPIPSPARTRATPAPITDATFGAVFDPRELYVGYRTPVGLVRAGLQSSQWGLGLLANAGRRDEDKLFNQRFGGDRAFRALFATTPLAPLGGELAQNLFLVLGADVVFRDDLADLLEGDRALQGILSLAWRDGDSLLGGYVAYRSQVDRDGDTLEVIALDAAATHSFDVADGAVVIDFGAEVAGFFADTDRVLARQTAQPVRVTAAGGALETSALHRATEIALHLDAGFATGDADPDDDTIYRFRFDPNYRVGLILFDHYIPAVTRLAYERAVDPDNLGEPPKGAEGLISDGTVENAIYLNPQLTFGAPDGLLAGVGALVAWSEQPLADPYNSFAGGGQPVGPNGGPASNELGVEVDVSAQMLIRLPASLDLELKGEVGILFPGAAFDDASGASARPQNLARGRVALRW